MIRIADPKDAEQLGKLNDAFNGKGETTIDHIRNSIMSNTQEVVVVADENGVLVGFVCIQLKKSFCYTDYMPEITEVYVVPAHRRKGIASEMITFAEEYCARKVSFHKYELLTGKKNAAAQSVYGKLGYADDGELHLSKRIER